MAGYTVRFYSFDNKLSAVAIISAESDALVYSRIKEQLNQQMKFRSAEILREEQLLKTIIKD